MNQHQISACKSNVVSLLSNGLTASKSHKMALGQRALAMLKEGKSPSLIRIELAVSSDKLESMVSLRYNGLTAIQAWKLELGKIIADLHAETAVFWEYDRLKAKQDLNILGLDDLPGDDWISRTVSKARHALIKNKDEEIVRKYLTNPDLYASDSLCSFAKECRNLGLVPKWKSNYRVRQLLVTAGVYSPAVKPEVTQTDWEFEHDPKGLGSLSQLMFAIKVTERGGSYATFANDNDSVDLIVKGKNGTPIRVQIKSTNSWYGGAEGRLRFNTSTTAVEFTGEGSKLYRRIPYEAGSIDVFALYAAPYDRWYLVPAEVVGSKGVVEVIEYETTSAANLRKWFDRFDLLDL